MKIHTLKLVGCSSLALLALVSCNKSADSSAKKPAATAQATPNAEGAFESLFVQTAPEGALPVGEARKVLATPGKEVVVEGMILAQGKAFMPQMAYFFLCDESKITKEKEEASSDNPEGYDWCCTDKEVLKEALLPVQVLGADGEVVAQSLEGVKGLKRTSKVILKGVAAPTSTKEAPLMTVTSCYLVP